MQPTKTTRPKHIVIIAGEASGDLHAASLIKALQASGKRFVFSGIGGQHMQAAGAEVISDLARFGVTGIVEVLKHIKTIKRAYRAIQAHLKKTKPDLLILVDYPGFNLRIAQYAKKVLGIRILYYISPQLWAWKPGRIKKIQATVDHMAVIFPFEKQIYETAGVKVSFVGHPLTKIKDNPSHTYPTRETLNLPADKQLLAVLPGSRINEIERHLPILYQTAKLLLLTHPNLHFVIPIANTLTIEQIRKYWDDTQIPCTLIQHQRATDIARLSDVIVVASGTASLECALLGKPMCIIYKIGIISAIAASLFLRIQYIGLCNVLTQKMTVPELLQYDFTPFELCKVLTALLDTEDKMGLIKAIIKRLSALKKSLSAEESDIELADLVLLTLGEEKKIAHKS